VTGPWRYGIRGDQIQDCLFSHSHASANLYNLDLPLPYQDRIVGKLIVSLSAASFNVSSFVFTNLMCIELSGGQERTRLRRAAFQDRRGLRRGSFVEADCGVPMPFERA